MAGLTIIGNESEDGLLPQFVLFSFWTSSSNQIKDKIKCLRSKDRLDFKISLVTRFFLQ